MANSCLYPQCVVAVNVPLQNDSFSSKNIDSPASIRLMELGISTIPANGHHLKQYENVEGSDTGTHLHVAISKHSCGTNYIYQFIGLKLIMYIS